MKLIKLTKLKANSGQSLVEIIIALAIGALLIGAASTAIVIVLRSSATSQIQQSSTVLAQDVIEKARSIAQGSWGSIYDLSKGSSTTYYFNTTSTQLFVIEGEEGIVDNDIRAGLVGYWKFDEASSTAAYDYSGNGNNGVLQNEVTRATSTCKVSYCLDFDGNNDYVDVGSISLSSPITFSAWINPSVLTSNDNPVVYNTTYLQVWSSKIRFVVNNAGITDYSITSADTWYHVVGTYDKDLASNNMKLYVDGVLRDQQSWPQEITTGSLLIGAYTGPQLYFDGLVDEVRIYNQALSADEVEHLYNSTLFTRYFYVENVNRDNSGDITASGGTNDPSTQKVTAILEWESVQGTSQFALSEYIMRWRNRVFRQTDWSGGSGQEGPLTVPSDKYASSSEINVSSIGTFRIEGL